MEHLLEVGERYILVDVKAFDLMEEAMCTCRDGLVTIDATWTNHTDRWLLLVHHTNLHRRGVAAQYDDWVLLHEERILHIACRMIVGKVERAIDVPVILHLGTLGNREAHTGEDVNDLLANKAQGVTCAHLVGIGRTSQVNIRIDVVFRLIFCLEGLDLLGSSSLQCIQLLAKFALLVSSHIAELCHQASDLALLAKILDTQRLNVFCVVCLQGLNLGHHGVNLLYHICSFYIFS